RGDDRGGVPGPGAAGDHLLLARHRPRTGQRAARSGLPDRAGRALRHGVADADDEFRRRPRLQPGRPQDRFGMNALALPARGPALLRVLTKDVGAAASLSVLLVFVIVALFGPLIAPYGPFDIVYDGAGHVVRLSPPTAAHWFGT